MSFSHPLKDERKIKSQKKGSGSVLILKAVKSEVLPYNNNNEFLKELASVLEQDYQVKYSFIELEKAGSNIDDFLSVFL